MQRFLVSWVARHCILESLYLESFSLKNNEEIERP